MNIKTPQEVIITFLQDNPDAFTKVDDVHGTNIQQLVEQSTAFTFLADDEEDVYTDADLKITY